MKIFRIAAVLGLAGLAAQAQLTRDQKLTDFNSLAGIFAKRYAPYEWKQQVFGVDALHLQPFLSRVAASRDDLEFYDICYDYISQFRDAHVQLTLASDFQASLGFSVDVYDGRVVVDEIQRAVLPRETYPFEVGDELVSLDGRTAAEWMEALARYNEAANPRATKRLSAGAITTRVQASIPSTAQLGDTATVVIRRQSGATETYTVPWLKSGTPLTIAGPVPDTYKTRSQPAAAGKRGPFDALRPLMYSGIRRPHSRLGIGSTVPVFSLPADFRQRLGGGDYYFSGTYQAGGKTLGFLRIPHFEPDDIEDALEQFDDEIAWMRDHTDGLVLDLMNNPGGYIIYQTEISRRLIPRPFPAVGHEMRATAEVVNMFSEACSEAEWAGAAEWQLAQCRAMLDDVLAAYHQNRGRTGPLPLDNLFIGSDLPAVGEMPPADTQYGKPILMLINELSFSSADALPAILQDNEAATLFGTRTAGAGGTVVGHEAGSYSEMNTRLTIGLMTRSKTIVTPDFPATNYVENVGVRPDIEEDYQTMDNLLNGGRTYVERFTARLLAAIK